MADIGSTIITGAFSLAAALGSVLLKHQLEHPREEPREHNEAPPARSVGKAGQFLPVLSLLLAAFICGLGTAIGKRARHPEWSAILFFLMIVGLVGVLWRYISRDAKHHLPLQLQIFAVWAGYASGWFAIEQRADIWLDALLVWLISATVGAIALGIAASRKRSR